MTESEYPFDFLATSEKLKKILTPTPLQRNTSLSNIYKCDVYLKREDLQVVRSYKIRGAYNKIISLQPEEKINGIVCSSAGNHAQGVAWSCHSLCIKGTIFMPIPTTQQKIIQTKFFGKENIEIIKVGDSFDECSVEAQAYAEKHHKTFIPPFDDPKIIEGQGTVGVEIFSELPQADIVFVPIGGGGLCAGVGKYLKQKNPAIQIIGVEPLGAPKMYQSLQKNKVITLSHIDKFVDGAAVKRVGDLPFLICKDILSDILLIDEGKVCSTILHLYSKEAIVVEPAGALSISALSLYREQIKGKTVVCIVSGSNNDIDRLQEIKERSLQYEGLKHYFLIRFAQRPGSLKDFVNNVLGTDDDITRFEYIQKNNKELAPALVGIELKDKKDYHLLLQRMNQHKVDYIPINKNDLLYSFLI